MHSVVQLLIKSLEEETKGNKTKKVSWKISLVYTPK
ncbi:hypothetical protein A2U01_0097665, partial [Trifolium medium]|nr:hypothetical protein [Trifolium medium]